VVESALMVLSIELVDDKSVATESVATESVAEESAAKVDDESVVNVES